MVGGRSNNKGSRSEHISRVALARPIMMESLVIGQQTKIPEAG